MSRCPVHWDDSFIEDIQAWVTQTSKSVQQVVMSSLFPANVLFGAASALVSKKQGDRSSAGSGLPTAPGGPSGLAAPWSAALPCVRSKAPRQESPLRPVTGAKPPTRDPRSVLCQEQSSPAGLPAPLRPALHLPDQTLTPSLGPFVTAQALSSPPCPLPSPLRAP